MASSKGNRKMSALSTICALIFQVVIVYGNGPLCLECPSEAFPTSCDTVTQCGPHEKCWLRGYENERGMGLFQSGCMDAMQCAKFPYNDTAVRRTSKREITTCLECCDGDYCNSGGCNLSGLSAMHGYAPVCFKCQDVRSPEDCRHIERCNQGDTCFIQKSSSGHYQMGCKATQNCRAPNYDNSCSMCCSDDFCNRQCTSTSSGHHHQNHVTTVVPAHSKTTPTVGTTIQPLLRCFDCPESSDPHCHFHHLCPQNHVCYSSTIRHGNNNQTYMFQCLHKTECPLDSTNTDWSVIGRRSNSDNGGYCCFSDDCNYLPPTITQLHTTPITSSMPTITDVGPLLKNTTLGVTVGMRCTATGSPKPVIHWDVPIPLPSSVNYVRPSMGDLIIWHVTRENAGYYTCVATNENGVDSQTIKLTIPLPSPVNYVRPSMGDLIIWHVTRENAGYYTCVATNENGVDSQTIKLTIPLPSPVNYVRPSMGDLIIWHVTRENAGYYTCVATNENGVDSQTIKLTVA